MDVEAPAGLKVLLLILCVVEQEAVLDDEEPAHRRTFSGTFGQI